MNDCCNHEPDPDATEMKIFYRTMLVEAFEVASGDGLSNMMVRLIQSYPEKLPLPAEPNTSDWILLPKDIFDQHYAEALYYTRDPFPQLVSETSIMSSDNRNEVANFFMEPFVGEELYSSSGAFANAEPSEDEVFALGNNIVQRFIARIPDMISKFAPGILSGVITVETVLWGAEIAFNFAIGKLPFPVPDVIKTKLWDMLESAIRAAWEANSTG